MYVLCFSTFSLCFFSSVFFFFCFVLFWSFVGNFCVKTGTIVHHLKFPYRWRICFWTFVIKFVSQWPNSRRNDRTIKTNANNELMHTHKKKTLLILSFFSTFLGPFDFRNIKCRCWHILSDNIEWMRTILCARQNFSVSAQCLLSYLVFGHPAPISFHRMMMTARQKAIRIQIFEYYKKYPNKRGLISFNKLGIISFNYCSSFSANIHRKDRKERSDFQSKQQKQKLGVKLWWKSF